MKGLAYLLSHWSGSGHLGEYGVSIPCTGRDKSVDPVTEDQWVGSPWQRPLGAYRHYCHVGRGGGSSLPAEVLSAELKNSVTSGSVLNPGIVLYHDSRSGITMHGRAFLDVCDTCVLLVAGLYEQRG